VMLSSNQALQESVPPAAKAIMKNGGKQTNHERQSS
jgi:hypothetical protein